MRFARRWTARSWLLLLALLDATLQPGAVHAQQGTDPSAGDVATPVADDVEASYSLDALQSLSSQLNSGASGASAAPAEGFGDGDSSERALAALPGGGGSASAQSVALPSGAGTQLGMGESFTTQLSTGGASYAIPLSLPRARGAVQPELTIGYSSAAGFGLAGSGWSFGSAAISRQTDRGLPGYDDRDDWHPAQDRFVFGGMELVPICTVSGTDCPGATLPLLEVMPVWADGWQYFRARVEGAFLRFFWSPDHLTWRVQSKDGTQLELGVPRDGSGYQGALERNPEKENEVFRWYVVRQYDVQGDVNTSMPAPVNVIQYRYFEDGGALYLSDIYDTSPVANATSNDLSQYAHHARIAYEMRPDIASSYRSGWQTEHALRVLRVDVTSKGDSATAPRELVRRYHFAYQPGAHRSLLTSLQMEGRCPSAIQENAAEALELTSCPRLPATRFEYQSVAGGAPLRDQQGNAFTPLAERVESLANSPPHSLDEGMTELADVNSDGLPDVLVTAGGLYEGKHGVYWNGLDREGARGFAPLDTMDIEPTADVLDANVLSLDNPNVAVLDLDGDGTMNLVHMPRARSYSVFRPEESEPGSGEFVWRGRAVGTASQQDLKIDFTGDNANVRVMDVNGDGLVDVVYSSPTELQTFFALGRFPGGADQFGGATWTTASTAEISNEPERACAPWSGSPVRFSDPDTQLADMNGDGLADIVRLRSGQILYWPGRGNGFFGTGERHDCLAGNFAAGRHVEMSAAPVFGVARPGALMVSDVNGDGLADLVEVRASSVDVYINDNGYAFTARHTLADTPFLPAASNYVRLTDINGSGTPDILWGAARDYRYIDLTGGVTPDLLVRVHNGIGKTLELEYEPSTEQMLRAEDSPEPWTSRAPAVVPVLVRSTVRDNLERIGRPGGVYVTEYSYRDPHYEGRQRELRGFREAVVATIGDANSPTSYARSVFLLGECPERWDGTTHDVCSPRERWRDNWREALKGLPVVTETYDATGVYMGTEHTMYTLLQLYAGRDERRVVVAQSSYKRTYVYDTAAFDASSAGETMVPDVSVAVPGVDGWEYRTLPLRSTTGMAQVRAYTAYDSFGNATIAAREGCVEGCPNGAAADETIFARSSFTLPEFDDSGWLWREFRSRVEGSSQPGVRRNELSHYYDSRGQVQQTYATLSGTLPLNRSALGTTTVPEQSSGMGAAVQIAISTNTYDEFGHLVFQRGPSGRCASSDYDPTYAQLPITARVYGGALDPETNCGDRALVRTLTYDRGLEVALTGRELDPAGRTLAPTLKRYDGFGRLLWRRDAAPNVSPRVCSADLDACGVLAPNPSIDVQYTLPADPLGTPYSTVRVRMLDGLTPDDPVYSERWIFTDGLGRSLGELATADPTAGDGGEWLASGVLLRDAKGAAARAYDPTFFTGDPATFPATAQATGGAFAAQQFDAFARPTWNYDAGKVTERNVYHALTSDSWDGEDLKQGGSHQNTPSTLYTDGHGRVVRQVTRALVNSVLEEHHTLFDYLPTGEVSRITRRRSGSPDVVRWMRYDSLGRMVLNVEPNTTTGFTPDHLTSTPPPGLRYAYNDAGDLVGDSDARGCGSNYHYDRGGRLIAEDRARCLSTQPVYTAPDLTTGDGTEVFFRYDLADPDSGALVDAAGTTLTVDAALLWGKVASIASVASKEVYRYDALGRRTGGASRVQRPGTPASALASRYAPRWYVTTSTLDAADRPRTSTTGMTVPELLGSGGTSQVNFGYSRRGVLTTVGGSYQTLFERAVFDARGQLTSVRLGDAAATERHIGYDLRGRVESVQTFRANLPLWSAPPQGLYSPPPAGSDPTIQLLLEDSYIDPETGYDEVGNILRIEDNRLPQEWPASAKPVTRSYTYDDHFRLVRTDYAHVGGNGWQSPYAAENADSTRVQPAPHGSATTRIANETWRYDHLGNIARGTDSESRFWDRSTGDRVHGSALDGPDRVLSASNRGLAPGSTAKGDLSVGYDPAGNVTTLIIRRDGACLPAGASCWQRYEYAWDEVGQLASARRWDLRTSPIDERTLNDGIAELAPARAPDAALGYGYAGSGERVTKTAVQASGATRHTVYVNAAYELRSTTWTGTDYALDAASASLRISAGGVSARIAYSAQNLPSPSSSHRHVFLELGDYLGSSTITVHKETGELVELTGYQSYGAAEHDYRPARWGQLREAFKFTDKEEDIELGLHYFGARYYSAALGVWLSPDPVTIHDAHGDLNPYAYVGGRATMAVDPDGRLPVPIITGLISVGVYAVGAKISNQPITVRGAVAAFAAGVVGNVVGGVGGAVLGYGVGSTIRGAPITAAGLASSAVGAAAGGAVSGNDFGSALAASMVGGTASYATNYAMTGEGSGRDFVSSLITGFASSVAAYGMQAAAESMKRKSEYEIRVVGSDFELRAETRATSHLIQTDVVIDLEKRTIRFSARIEDLKIGSPSTRVGA